MSGQERRYAIGLASGVKQMRAWAAITLAVALLQSCATAPSDEKGVLIAPGTYFTTPGPAELGYAVNATQLITARFRGETHVFQTQIMISSDRLVLIGLDPFGRRALTVTSTGSGVTAAAEPWVPDGLRTANILADMAIVYWPEDAVRRGLKDSGAALDVDPQRRTITAGGKEIIHVEYGPFEQTGWARSARYINIAFGYELDIRSVPQQ